MATNERETNLIIRATDLTQQPIKQVVDQVKSLVAILQQQIEASKNGTTTTAAFTKALNDVGKATDELLKQKAALQAADLKEQAVAERLAALREKEAQRDALLASAPDPSTRTNAQVRALNTLENQVTRAGAALARAQQQYESMVRRLEGLGVAARNAEESQRLLTQAMERQAQAIEGGDVRAIRDATARLEQLRAASLSAKDANDVLTDSLFAVSEALQRGRQANVEFLPNQQRAQAQAAETRQSQAAEEAAARARAEQAQQAEQMAGFRAVAARAVEQNRAQAAALHAPLQEAAPSLTDSIVARLDAGTTKADVSALYAEVLRLHGALTDGAGSAKQLGTELRALSEAEAQIKRQAGIVDAYVAAREAAKKAADEFALATAQVARFEEAARNATTPKDAAEATSNLTALQRRIGSAGGPGEDRSGLAGRAQSAREGEARELAALKAIGIEADEVGDAFRRLTQAASLAANTRIAANEAELNSFKKLAQEAVARAQATEAQAAAQRASAGGISAPSGARDQVQATLSAIPSRHGDLGETTDADAAIEKLNATLSKGGVFASTYQKNMENVYSIQRKLAGDASLIDSFTRQQEAAARADAELDKARSELAAVAAQMQAATAPSSELTSALARAEKAFQAASNGATAEAAALAKLQAQMKTAKIDHTDLAAATEKLVASGKKLNEAQAAVSKKETGLFGLRPYELKNLEYQIGDIYTQLSLGQGLVRTFNSQGDQILQIFDFSIARLKLFIAYGAPAAAAIYGVVEALLQAKEKADALREFNARIIANADGAIYSAKAMEEATKSIQHYGASFTEAKDAVEEFMQAGLRPDRFEQFGKVAQDLADVYGKKFPEAAKEVTSAFTHGFDAIAKLNEQYNFLTAAQLANTKELIDAGHAEEGRTFALDIFIAKQDEAASKSRSTWQTEVRNLTRAWDEFKTTLADSGAIQLFVQYLEQAVTQMSALVRLMSGDLSFHNFNEAVTRSSSNLGKMSPQREMLNDLQARRGEVESTLANASSPAVPGFEGGPSASLPADPARIAALKKQLADIDARIATLRTEVNSEGLAGALATLEKRRDDLRAGRVRPESQTDNTVGRESGGDASAANSKSTASGSAQFLDKTFFEQLRKHRPDLAKGLSDDQLKPLKNSDALQRELAAAYAKENAAALTQAGFDASPANIAMAHRFGPTGAARVLGAAPDTPIDKVVDAKVMTANPDLAGKTAAQVTAGYAASTANVATEKQLDAEIASLKEKMGVLGASATDTAHAVGVLGANSERTQSATVRFTDELDRSTAMERDRNLRGAAGRERDAGIVAEFRRTQENKAAAAKIDPSTNPAAQKSIDDAVEFQRAKLAEIRDKQDAADADKRLKAEQALANELMAIRAKVDSQDKTNIAARVRAVDEEYAKIEGTIENARKRGVTDIGGESLETFEKRVEAAKAALKEQVTVQGAEEVVNKVLQERKSVYTAITNDLKTGAISIAEAFRRMAEATSNFALRIKKAVGDAKGALGNVPQTPATDAARAKFDGVAANDNKDQGTEQMGFVKNSLERINALAAARKETEKEQAELVKAGAETTDEAEKKIKAAYDRTGAASRALIADTQKQLDLMKQMGAIGPEDYEKLTAALKKAGTETQYVSQFQRDLLKTIEGSVVSRGVAAFDTIGQALGNLAAGTGKLKDVFSAVGQAFASFAAGVLKDLAELIIRTMIFKAVQSAVGAYTGGTSTALTSAAGAAVSAGTAVAHGGAMVGPGPFGMTRMVNPAVFENARRFHQGGMVSGLSADEVPAILQQGEEVLSKTDMRNQNNGGKRAPANDQGQSIRNVLVFGDAELAGAMASSHGEKVVLNHLKRNLPTVRQWIGK